VISRRVRRQNAPQAWKMASGAGWETCVDAARDRDALSGGAKSWLVRGPCTPSPTATPDAVKPCPRSLSDATGDSASPPGVGRKVKERCCTTSQRLVRYREGPCLEVSMTLTIDVDLPTELNRFRLPKAVDARLQALLDRQDSGQPLTTDEHDEAEGLVNLAEFLTLLRLRAERMTP
jgi:hypothetical protein